MAADAATLGGSCLRISNEQVVESDSKAGLLLGFVSLAGCLQVAPLQDVHVLSPPSPCLLFPPHPEWHVCAGRCLRRDEVTAA